MRKKKTKEEFIELSKKKFGDLFDYSKVNYADSKTKVILICKKCGHEFEIVPASHLRRKGCPYCEGYRVNTEKFIEKARKVHGGKYDYSKTNYVNKRTKVIITCPIHGDFLQNPHLHISNGCGCPKCGEEKVSQHLDCSYNPRKTKEQFQKDLDEKFGGIYEIVGEYTNNKTHTEIYCHKKYKDGKEHGVFRSRPDGLINGHGCPKCSHQTSSAENEIFEYIKTVYCGTVVHNNRIILRGKEIDIYLPELKIGFEYDGLIWHSEDYKGRYNLLEKMLECEKMGIRLIHIFEDEWISKKDICKSRIKSLLQGSSHIFARKCKIKELPYKDASSFLHENHIQDSVPSKVNIGLFYEDELVSVMTFGSLRRNLGYISKKDKYFEMLRFASKKGVNVIGGASKLLSYFIKTYNPEEIISYADKRWSNGNLYEKIGFTYTGDTKPNYFYITTNSQKRFSRFSYRKDILVKKYNCPPDITEKEFCRQIGFLRIYDCGNMKYVWKKKENS